MLSRIICVFFITFSFSMNAQTIFGAWNSFDEETNRLESVIEVYEKNDQEIVARKASGVMRSVPGTNVSLAPPA